MTDNKPIIQQKVSEAADWGQNMRKKNLGQFSAKRIPSWEGAGEEQAKL